MKILTTTVLAAAIAATAAFSTPAAAQAYPGKPIRWIVPYTPAGFTDVVTRMVLQKVQEQTGWNIIVENKPGANSILGAGEVARAAGDGYTMLTVIGSRASFARLTSSRSWPPSPNRSVASIPDAGRRA